MNFANKTRGARAILNWTREQLTARSALSVPGITNIEQGGSPNARSQNKIVRAFENAGIYFTRNGIEQDDGLFSILTDEDPEACYLALLDDVATAMENSKNKELLITYADDSASSAAVNGRHRELRASGVAMRQLVEAGNSYLMGPLEEYRTIPSDRFINRVSLVYAKNVAIVTSGENTITIFRDAVNAERERNTFDLLWSTLSPPLESTADEKF